MERLRETLVAGALAGAVVACGAPAVDMLGDAMRDAGGLLVDAGALLTDAGLALDGAAVDVDAAADAMGSDASAQAGPAVEFYEAECDQENEYGHVIDGRYGGIREMYRDFAVDTSGLAHVTALGCDPQRIPVYKCPESADPRFCEGAPLRDLDCTSAAFAIGDGVIRVRCGNKGILPDGSVASWVGYKRAKLFVSRL